MGPPPRTHRNSKYYTICSCFFLVIKHVMYNIRTIARVHSAAGSDRNAEEREREKRLTIKNRAGASSPPSRVHPGRASKRAGGGPHAPFRKQFAQTLSSRGDVRDDCSTSSSSS